MTDQSQTSDAHRTDLPSLLWHLLAGPWMAIGVAGMMALALALRSVIPQMPAEARPDPQAWMALLPGILSKSSGFFHAAGLFDVADSLWFHILLALAALVLLVRGSESAEFAWRALRHTSRAPTNAQQPPQLVSSGEFATPLSYDDALSETRRVLVESGASTIGATSDGSLFATGGSLLLWTRPLMYAALLVALIGLAISTIFGWQLNDWRPVPGDTLNVGHGTSYSLRLDSFSLRLSTGGQLLDYESQITWSEGDEVVGQPQLGIGEPAAHRATMVNLVGFVPSVQLRGWDDTGRPLALQAEGQEISTPGKADVSFSSAESRSLIYLPDQGQLLALSFAPNCPDGRPALTLASTPLTDHDAPYRPVSAILYQSGDVALPGLRLEADLSYRPMLRVSHRPASGVVLAGLVLALSALAASWAAPVRLLWVEFQPGSRGETTVHLASLPTPTGGRWSSRVASELARRLAGDD